ncbi:MAG: T9SS C-terminal target domain-containing protein [Bacteroidetes bacterium]|nr:MAG: T9SS C-terminal target domain-containing protein [Bacteroidota bacterium]
MQFNYLNLLVLASLISFQAASQEFFPKGLTEAEKKDYQEYITHFEYGDKGINPPSLPPRTPGEFEEAGGVIVTWASYSSELREIVRHSRLRVPVYIIASNPSNVQSFLTQGGVSLENVIILQLPFNSVWVRDYGPQSIYLQGTDELAFVDWVYNRPHRPNDNMLPVNLASELNLDVFQMTTQPNRLVHTGGNLMFDGHGTAFSSKLVLTENSALSASQIDDIMFDFTGTTRYIKMDELPYDNISHLDMHMKLLDEETLLVAEFPPGVSDGPYIESNLTYLLDNYQTCYDRDYQVVRIPMVPSPNDNYPPNAHYRTFTNSLILNDLVLVPQYYNTSLNGQAISIYQNAMPGYEIVGIDMENVIPASGAIHCITREIAATDPIFISHAPIREVEDDATVYPIEAIIKNANGITSASVFYKVNDEASFTEIPMNSQGGDVFTAAIPFQPCHSNISYYISASNQNKTITRPFVAPHNYWTFTAGGELVDFAANNLSGDVNEEIIFYYTGCLTEDEIDEALWHFGEGAVPQTATGITNHSVIYETEGYKTISLTINGEEVVKENLILITSETTWKLTITAEGQGNTTPVPGTYTFIEGTEVELIATPAEGWLFEEWVLNTDNFYENDTISVTLDNDISATAIFRQIETSIPQFESQFSFDVFPNPSQGIFNIVMSPSNGPVAIRIINIQGQVVFSDQVVADRWDQHFPVDLRNENQGLYFVQITGEHGSLTRRIILK